MVRIDNLANGVCASYKNIGLLVYRENKLFLLLGWSCCDDEPTSGRQVLLEFSPALPSNIEVLEIISSDSGRYIALICESGVFIVTVGNELCQILGVANSRSVIERVHNHYFVKCNELSPLMFSGRHARKVVKLRWFHTEADKHLLAVLSDDSVVRIHDLRGEGDFKVTTLRVDFASVIKDEFAEPEPESRTSKFFGLRKTIVSFDFGLTIHNSNTDTNLYTVFAIDSDATIHYAVFNTETYQCLGPTGPLRLRYTMSSSQMLGCDAVDMKYIRHWYSDVAPIIAVASGKGMIYHLMLAQTTAEFDECEFDYGSFYEAYLCDVYKFDVARGKGDTVLSQDSSVSSKYFIRSSRAVASLNLSTWLSDISKIGNRESQSRPNPPTLNYAAVQVPDAASKDNFVSASSLQLMDDGEVPEDNKTVLCRRFVIFATTKSGKTYSKVVSELVIPERKEEPQPTVQSHNGSYGQSALRGVVSDPRVSSFREASIPLLILSDVPEAQQVTAIMAMSANLNDATARLSEASGCYKKICDDMIKEFTAIRGVEKALISKQVTLLDELSDTKARWSTIKARLQRFHRREQALETKIERLALNQPLTPAEQKMFESLKEFHSRIKKIRGTVGVISDRVNGYHGSQENFTGIEENSKMSANTYAVLQNKFALSDLQIAYGGLKRRTNRLLQQVERMEEKANELN